MGILYFFITKLVAALFLLLLIPCIYSIWMSIGLIVSIKRHQEFFSSIVKFHRSFMAFVKRFVEYWFPILLSLF